MKCKRKHLFILLVFLFSFCFPLAFPQDTSSEQILIYKSELVQLNNNLLHLSLLSQTLEEQLLAMKLSSSNLLTLLDSLSAEKDNLDKQLKSLGEELQNLRTQYNLSLQDLETLKGQLESLENSYKTLSVSFEAYKLEVNKELSKLKAQNTVLTIASATGGAATVLFAILYLIEKFGD